jgi:hypothetical protein
MIRTALIAALLVVALAFAACGGDDSTSSGTPTQGIPTGSGDPGTSGTATGTPAPTPTAGPPTDSPTPSPSPFLNFHLRGDVTDDMYIIRQQCIKSGDGYQITLHGVQNTVAIGIVVGTSTTGTIDFGQSGSQADAVAIQYGSRGGNPDKYYYGVAGEDGTGGTITLDAGGSGSLDNLSVPPSSVAPAGAVAPVTISGSWTCT